MHKYYVTALCLIVFQAALGCGEKFLCEQQDKQQSSDKVESNASSLKDKVPSQMTGGSSKYHSLPNLNDLKKTK